MRIDSYDQFGDLLGTAYAPDGIPVQKDVKDIPVDIEATTAPDVSRVVVAVEKQGTSNTWITTASNDTHLNLHEDGVTILGNGPSVIHGLLIIEAAFASSRAAGSTAAARGASSAALDPPSPSTACGLATARRLGRRRHERADRPLSAGRDVAFGDIANRDGRWRAPGCDASGKLRCRSGHSACTKGVPRWAS